MRRQKEMVNAEIERQWQDILDCNIADEMDQACLPLVRFITTISVNMMGDLNLGSTDGQTATPQQTSRKCYKDVSTMPSGTKLGSFQTRKGYLLDDEGVVDRVNSTPDIKAADQIKSDGNDRIESIAFSKPNAVAVSFVP